MRKYEFRGKRQRDNSWIYGLLTNDTYGHYRIQFDANQFSQVVIPETVGRLIGKKDIKDIPIYEGDIFKFKFIEELNKPIELIGSFAWNDEDLSYEIDIYLNEHPEYVCLHYIGNGQMYDFEIIGNIFDNPELLNK